MTRKMREEDKKQNSKVNQAREEFEQQRKKMGGIHQQ
jgi:hypothetical protein